MRPSVEKEILEAIKQNDRTQLEDLVNEYGAEAVRADQDPEVLTALHWAAGAGDVQIVDFFLSEALGADVNALRVNNFSPLHAAAMNGHTKVCARLLEAGANVNVQTTPQGYAPLHSAAFGGHLETIIALLEYGADVTLRNYRDEQPVDTARRQGQDVVAQYLTDEMG